MKSFITILILALVLGGGYYLITKNSEPKNSVMESDNAMMEEGNGAMMEDEGGHMDDGTMMQDEDMHMNDGMMMDDSSTSMMEAAVKEFTVEGGNFFFSPSTMTVKKGDTVRVTFKNIGGFHDFVIDEFNVATNKAQAPDERTVEFVADKAGSFEYYCSVGNHRAQGMVGTLTVTE